MSIEALSAIGAATQTAALGSTQLSAPPATAFSTVLDQISSLNTQFATNDQAIKSMALGDSTSLHGVMMDLERTRLTFDLMLQVRNKLLDAYQELMRMQV